MCLSSTWESIFPWSNPLLMLLALQMLMAMQLPTLLSFEVEKTCNAYVNAALLVQFLCLLLILHNNAHPAQKFVCFTVGRCCCGCWMHMQCAMVRCWMVVASSCRHLSWLVVHASAISSRTYLLRAWASSTLPSTFFMHFPVYGSDGKRYFVAPDTTLTTSVSEQFPVTSMNQSEGLG